MPKSKQYLKWLASSLSSICIAANIYAADPIRVGFVGGISGPCGALVDSEMKGVEMAIEAINSAGGLLDRQVELVTRDSKTKPDEGAKLARDLATNENIDVLTGVCSSSVMLAISAVSKEFKLPFYSTVANTQKGNIEAYQPYFWQTQANAMMEAVAAAEVIAQNVNYKRIVPMGFDYEWGHTSVQVFTDTLKKLRPDIEITDPIYPKIGESNMTAYITAALSKRPDIIYAAVFGGGLVSLIKQGKSFGLFKQTRLMTLMTVDTLETMGADIPQEGIWGTSRAPFYALLDNEKAKSFIDEYKAAYGEYPADWAISGYDGMMFYAEAVKAAGTTEAESLMKAVHTISYDGLRSDGLTVRAFDGQMNTPVYVGEVTHQSDFGFPIMQNVVKVTADKTMLSEEETDALRASAQ